MPITRIWELLVLKYNNEISEEELRELELLLQQNQDVLEMNEVLLNLHELPLAKMTTAADERKSVEAIKLKLADYKEQNKKAEDVIAVYEENRRRKKVYRWITGALCMAALVTLGIWLSWSGEITPNEEVVKMNEVVTNGGSKTTIHLPDGSSVILNTGSKLTYNKDFGVGGREIYLKGEAFFTIAKNEQLPLTVHAGAVDIKVKGTVFNVKAYAEDSTVEASLITGVIEVFSQNDPERKILLRPKEKILIGKSSTISSSENEKPQVQSGEQVFALGKIKPNPADSSISEIAWIENKLAFYKEPFETLARKMERWYNVSIHFEDERLSSLTFTGSFEKEDITEALDALRDITNFDYTIENRNITIRRHK